MKNDKNIKKNEGSGFDHVPIYRSYGVFRRDGLPRKILERFYQAIATLVLVVLGFAAVLTIYTAIIYAPLLISLSIIAIFVTILLYRPIRLFAKRINFMRKLKKYCKRNYFKLTVNRRFPQNMYQNNKQPDFSVDTGRKTYYVCFLTVKKYSSHVTFINENKIRITTRINAERNKFYQIYDIKPKKVDKTFSFPFVNDSYNRSKKIIKAVVLNPAPHSIFIMDKTGKEQISGTGDLIFGNYYIHTGSGFLNTIDREPKN